MRFPQAQTKKSGENVKKVRIHEEEAGWMEAARKEKEREAARARAEQEWMVWERREEIQKQIEADEEAQHRRMMMGGVYPTKRRSECGGLYSKVVF